MVEFTSTRKRMTSILRTPDDRIVVMSKGADSVLLPLLRKNKDDPKAEQL